MRLRRVVLVLLLFSILTIPPVAFAQDPVTHVVQPGENLFRIALRYGVDMNELAQVNGINDLTRIYAGQSLTIPGLSVPDSSPVVENPLVATAPLVHVVQRGETLQTIAALYSVTVEQILQANDIPNPNRILAGDTINIWSNDPAVTSNTPVVTEPIVTEVDTTTQAVENQPETVSVVHTVLAGEHLSQIARNYGVNWTQIAEANGITDPNRIYAGMQITIPNTTTTISGSYVVQQPSNIPTPTITVGKQIVVDISSSMIHAFQDGSLVRSVIVSTGLPATPTVQGDFTIQRKLDSQTMSGPGYYLPGVPWVMYFYQGYAIHGTYWHSNFGQPMSHGCVNLPTDEAAWFYTFAEIGTPVHVQY